MSPPQQAGRLACWLIAAAFAGQPALGQQLPTLPGLPGQSSEQPGEAGTAGGPAAPASAVEPDEAELARRAAIQAARERGWLILPSVGLREIGTDNGPLATGAGRESDLISALSGTVTLYVRQPRFEADGSYALQFDDYAAGHGSSRVLANGGLAGTFDVAEHKLFLSGGVFSARTIDNPFGLRSDSGSTSNADSITQFRLEPYLTGESVDKTFRYRISSQNGWTPGASSVATFGQRPDAYAGHHLGEFEIRPLPLGALLTIERNQTHYGAPFDETLSDEAARLIPRYHVGPLLLVGVRTGFERNDYALRSSDRQRRILGAELEWVPDAHTRLHAYGESKTFGPAWRADFQEHGNIISLGAQGSRQVQTSAQSLFRLSGIAELQTLVDAIYSTRYPNPADRARIVQQIMTGFGLSATDLSGSVNLYTPSVYRVSDVSAAAAIVTPRELVSVSIFRANNEILQFASSAPTVAQLAIGSYVESGGTLILSHRLQRRLALSLKGQFVHTEGNAAVDASRATQRRLTLQVSQGLSPRLQGTAGAMHQSVTSSIVGDVTENEVFVGLVYWPSL